MRSFLLGGLLGLVAGGVGVLAATVLSFLHPPKPARAQRRF